MTPKDFKTARYKLGLTESQLTRILGYKNTNNVRRMGMDPSRTSHRQVSVPVELVMRYMLRDLTEGRWRPPLYGGNRPSRFPKYPTF